jgi:alkylation response protein AidB-like acyl-CoA dehydrogenase
LARVAALRLDEDPRAAVVDAAAARLSAARAALRSSYAAFQVLGALGMTEEGPISGVARRIRQWTLSYPSEARARALLEPLDLPEAR